MSTFDAVSAFDAVFAGRSGHFVDHIGRSEPLEIAQWSSEPDWVDRALFIDPCHGATIDVGCGPGRLVAALAARKVPAMGIDVSTEAVRQTRIRGALALRRDVFGTIPGEGRWAHALLADGNLGIGGDPVRLLTRLGDVLVAGGTVIAEVAEHGAGFVRDRRRLRVDGRLSAHFAWAVVGLDAIEDVAAGASMSVASFQSVGGRHNGNVGPDPFMRLPRVEDIEKRLPNPEDFTSRARGTELTARIGTALGICFGICFLTGMWSHFQYNPPGWLPIGPHPTQLYRVTQGLHVMSGMAAIPLLLVKLWGVYPRLFILPPKKLSRAFVVDVLEKASIGVLVAAALFQLTTGALNIAQWYPWAFSFRRTHEAVAWVAIGALLVHIAFKLPIIRTALGADLEHRDDDDHHDSTDDDDQQHGPTRRSVLLGASAASGLAVLLTAGQTVPFLRKLSVFGVRDGEGPEDLPINRTARAARADKTALDPNFTLEIIVGDTTMAFTREQLLALPQRTHRLPIACVEGWSRSAIWTGVSIRDLLELAGGDPDSVVKVRSLQTKGAFGVSELPANYVRDYRTMLALELNGKTLTVDHGYPCRIIAPNRPGVFQTKWVRQLEVKV